MVQVATKNIHYSRVRMSLGNGAIIGRLDGINYTRSKSYQPERRGFYKPRHFEYDAYIFASANEALKCQIDGTYFFATKRDLISNVNDSDLCNDMETSIIEFNDGFICVNGFNPIARFRFIDCTVKYA